MLSIPAHQLRNPGALSITGDGKGTTIITTADADGAITRQKVPGNTGSSAPIDWSFSEQAAKLLAVLAKRAPGDLTIKASADGTTVQVDGGLGAATVRIDGTGTAPTLPNVPKRENLIEVPTASFQASVNNVASVAGTDAARAFLQGAHLDFGSESNPAVTMRSTDSYRAVSATVPHVGSSPSVASVLVFASQLKRAASRLSTETTFLGVCDNGSLYMWDTAVSHYLPHLAADSYPVDGLEKHEKTVRPHTVSIDTDDLVRKVMHLMDVSSVVGNTDLKSTVVKLSQGDDEAVSLAPYGADHSVGFTEALSLPSASTTSPDSAQFPGVAIDARFLLDAVKAAGGPSVTITAGTVQEGVLVKGDSTSKQVIALHR